MARHLRRIAITNSLQDPLGWRPPDVISGADMEAAIVAGKATAFSQVITFIRRYRQTWWLSTDAGWLEVHHSVAAVLDEHAERLRQPSCKDSANVAAIRAVIGLGREATEAAASHQ